MNNDEANGSSSGLCRACHNLTIYEARHFHQYGLLVPSDICLPKGWAISHGGLTMPPLSATEEAFRHDTLVWQDQMMDADCNCLENHADNNAWGSNSG